MSERGHRDDRAAKATASSSLPLMTLLLLFIAIALLSGLALAANGGGPYLDIMEPEDGKTIGGKSIWVKGQTDAQAVVTVMVDHDGNTTTYSDQAPGSGYFDFYLPVSEGPNRITVRSVLQNGEPSVVELNIGVDQTPPDIKIERPPTNPAYTNQRIYQITGSVSDPDMPIIPPFTTPTGVFSREVELAEGKNEIDIRFSDPYGNEAVVWLIIYADFAPPMVEIALPDGDTHVTGYGVVEMRGTVWNATRVVVVHKGVEHEVVHVGGDWNSTGSWMHTLELGPLDIDQDVVVRAFDFSGNVAEDSVRIILDMVPPSLDIEFYHEFDSPLVRIDGTTDLDVKVIDINGVVYPVIDGEIAVLVSLKEGENELVLLVMDDVGNNATLTETFWYDNGPPRLKVKNPPDWNGSRVIIKGSTSPNVRTVVIDRVSYPVEDGKFRVEIKPEEGQKVLVVSVKDPADNRVSVTVDVTDPKMTRTVVYVGIMICVAAVMMAISYFYIRRRT